MDLFKEENPPLSKRVISQNLDEFIGQKHLIGPNKPIRIMIEKKILHSMVFVGPPACGKTTLANVISNEFNFLFIKESALTLDSDSLKRIFNISSQKILFIDEIHRLTKPKQDMLLGPMERGEIYIIGATTENPLFILQPALRSRIFIFELNPLTNDEKKQIILAALKKDKFFSNYDIVFEDNALNNLIELSFDIRKALNCLEIILQQEIKEKTNKTFENQKSKDQNVIIVKNSAINSILQFKETLYSSFDGHYDAISAYIKSIRGSDINASLYYLALMLESGEDPLFIARRLVILASEDIGLAYPVALPIATSALLSIEKIGMPEARIILAEVTSLFSMLPKSNSAYQGLENAIKDIREKPIMKIPSHLKNIELKAYDKKEKDIYKYPHDYPKHYIRQDYLEKEKKFFTPGNLGFESKLSKWYESLINMEDMNSKESIEKEIND